jgi:hypothetical protein
LGAIDWLAPAYHHQGRAREMPDRGSALQLSVLNKLAEGIRQSLALADSLGLSFVGIHLCDALETLQREIPRLTHPASQDPPDDSQR